MLLSGFRQFLATFERASPVCACVCVCREEKQLKERVRVQVNCRSIFLEHTQADVCKRVVATDLSAPSQATRLTCETRLELREEE